MRSDHARDLTKVLFLDIETVPQQYDWSSLDERTAKLFSDKTRFEQERNAKSAEEIYGEKGGILAEFGKIICIGVGSLHRSGEDLAMRVTSFQGDDEAEVLRQFADLLNKHYNTDDHWLCGHNGKEFDFPYMGRRYLIHQLPLPKIIAEIQSAKPWDVRVIDTMNLWKFGDFKSFTSLDLLCAILDIPSPKDDMDGSMVGKVFWEDHDHDRIARYCEQDVIATAQVLLRFARLPIVAAGLITRA